MLNLVAYLVLKETWPEVKICVDSMWQVACLAGQGPGRSEAGSLGTRKHRVEA